MRDYERQPRFGESDVSRERRVFPDAAAVLNRFEAELFPAQRGVSEPHVRQPQVEGEILHAKYAVLSRSALSELVGLDALRTRAETVEGETRGEVGNASVLFQRTDTRVLMRSIEIPGAGGSTTVRYKKERVGDREVEEVNILDQSGDRVADRNLRITLREGKYQVAFEYNSEEYVTVRTTSTFRDTPEGQIIGAATDVRTFEGEPVD